MSTFLTIDEMADVLRVPKSWLYGVTRKKGKGTIPMIRVGKYIRFEEDKVLEWIGRQQGNADDFGT